MDLSHLNFQALVNKVVHASQYWLPHPFHVFSTAEERIFIPYLLTSLVVAFITVCFFQKKNLKAAWQEIFNPKLIKNVHHIPDLQYFYVNHILFFLVLVPSTVGLLKINSDLMQGVVGSLHLTGALGQSNWMIITAFTIASVILSDLAIYITHRLQHSVPWLWEFHKTHHSAEILTPMTEYRIHPVDFLLGFVISFTLVGLLDGAFRGLFIGDIAEWKVWGVNAIQMVYYATFFNLRHSHVWVYFGPFWSRFIISPAQHQIHHSQAEEHWDVNFGQMLGVWDWLFGTMYYPKNGYEEIVFGLSEPEDRKNYKSLWGLYMSPVISIWSQVRHGAKPAASKETA